MFCWDQPNHWQGHQNDQAAQPEKWEGEREEEQFGLSSRRLPPEAIDGLQLALSVSHVQRNCTILLPTV